YITAVAILSPATVGEAERRPASVGAQSTREGMEATAAPSSLSASNELAHARKIAAVVAEAPDGNTWVSGLGFVLIICGSLGGIWAGFFTPTEGAGVGALIAFVVGVLKGMRLRDIYDAILAVGRAAGPIMVIVFAAQLYARTLALSGIGPAIESALIDSG